MLDLFLLKERFQIEQRSTVLVELCESDFILQTARTSAWSG